MKRVLSLLLSLIISGLFPCFAFADIQQVTTQSNQDPIVTTNINPIENIDVVRNQMPLHSRLSKVYTGYQYTVTNKNPFEIDILSGQITDGINGQMGYLNVEKSSAAAIGATIGGGFVLGIVSLGITFLVALIATPFIYAGNHAANKKARNESLAYPNQVEIGMLNSGESININTLVPIGQNPKLKLTFREFKTKEIYSLTK